MFPYSPRKRTRAALFPNRVDPIEMKRRKQELLRLSERVAFNLRESFVGREMPVLLESGGKEGMTPNFLRVVIDQQGYRANEIVKVKLIENTAEGFLGRVL